MRPQMLGPLLGTMALHASLNASMLASLLKTTESKVRQWTAGTSEVPVSHLLRVSKLIAVLTWLYSRRAMVKGTKQDERLKVLEQYLHNFRLMADLKPKRRRAH